MKIQGMHKLVDHIINTLFISDKKRIRKWIDRIVKQNQECHGHSDNAFIYNGMFFRHSAYCGLIPKRTALHSSLAPEMEAILNDEKIIESQKSFVRQIIVQLLDPCETLQDIRDALPEFLVNCVPELPRDRTRPAAYTIAGNPRAMRQYEKMLPNIQVYSATRLI